MCWIFSSDGKSLLAMYGRPRFEFLGQEEILEAMAASHSVFLPGGIPIRQKRLAGYCPWGCKEWTLTSELRRCIWSLITENSEDGEPEDNSLYSDPGKWFSLMTATYMPTRHSEAYFKDKLEFVFWILKIAHVFICPGRWTYVIRKQYWILLQKVQKTCKI